MKDFAAILYVFLAFVLIGFVCWLTSSAWPLLGLFLIPSITFETTTRKNRRHEK